MAGLAYSGAASNRFLADWTAQLTDSNDDWWRDAPTLAARSWHLYDNDPYFHALVETLVGGVFGATGLRHRSLYQEDAKPDTSDPERQVRREIDKCMASACSRKRLDAIGLLSWRDMSAMIYRSALVAGDGFAVRCWKPNRVDAYQATCWRIIDPARVSNPNFGANTATMFEGFELDSDGRPVAIHVQKSHPNLQRIASSFAWQRIPIFAADGSRNVIHRKRVKRPEQIRGLGCAAPVLVYLRMLSQTTEAWVIAKRIQASYALMIKTEDPAKAAQADKFGALLTGNSPIKPGIKYYHNHEEVKPLDYQFQGNDYEQFRNPIIEAVCATECVPFEMVLQRLTKSNLASSRAALLSYYTTCQREQDGQIEDVEQVRVEAVLREEIARGRLTVRTDNWDEITAGRFLRPPRVWPDPLKEANAVRAWVDLGRSLSGAYAEAGLDFESEILQRAQDNALLAAQGVSISEETAAKPTVTEPEEVEAVDDPADDEDDEPDAEKPDAAEQMSAVVANLASMFQSIKAAAPSITINNPAQPAPVVTLNAAPITIQPAPVAVQAAAAPVVTVAPPIVTVEHHAAPITLQTAPPVITVQASDCPAPIVNVSPTPVTIDNQVIVPARTVKAVPQRDGSVLMTPQEEG